MRVNSVPPTARLDAARGVSGVRGTGARRAARRRSAPAAPRRPRARSGRPRPRGPRRRRPARVSGSSRQAAIAPDDLRPGRRRRRVVEPAGAPRGRRGRPTPPASGASTGRPEAWASCTAWQKVSCGPVCTKASKRGVRAGQLGAAAEAEEVRAWAAARPGGRARGRRRRRPRAPRAGPRGRRAARPASPRRAGPRSRRASRRAGRARRAGPSSRRPGWKRAVSTPRPHRCTRGTPWSRSASTAQRDGARVRAAPLCRRRIQRQAARAVSPTPYDAAKPATSVW